MTTFIPSFQLATLTMSIPQAMRPSKWLRRWIAWIAITTSLGVIGSNWRTNRRSRWCWSRLHCWWSTRKCWKPSGGRWAFNMVRKWMLKKLIQSEAGKIRFVARIQFQAQFALLRFYHLFPWECEVWRVSLNQSEWSVSMTHSHSLWWPMSPSKMTLLLSAQSHDVNRSDVNDRLCQGSCTVIYQFVVCASWFVSWSD